MGSMTRGLKNININIRVGSKKKKEKLREGYEKN